MRQACLNTTGAVADDGVADLKSGPFVAPVENRRERLFALEQRRLHQVVAVQKEQIEGEVDQLLGAALRERPFQSGEARPPSSAWGFLWTWCGHENRRPGSLPGPVG
jgi:hypothetical protein